jgi:hypothetical protein
MPLLQLPDCDFSKAHSRFGIMILQGDISLIVSATGHQSQAYEPMANGAVISELKISYMLIATPTKFSYCP